MSRTGEARAKRFEGFRREPDAALRGIQVYEEAQDAGAVGGAGGKGIEMQEIVTRMEARGAAFFFYGTVAGVVELPLSCVRRKESAEEFDGTFRKFAQDATQGLGFGLLG